MNLLDSHKMFFCRYFLNKSTSIGKSHLKSANAFCNTHLRIIGIIIQYHSSKIALAICPLPY